MLTPQDVQGLAGEMAQQPDDLSWVAGSTWLTES